MPTQRHLISTLLSNNHITKNNHHERNNFSGKTKQGKEITHIQTQRRFTIKKINW